MVRSGADGEVQRPTRRPRCLLHLLGGAGRSFDPFGLLLVQFLFLLDLQDQILDLLALRLHPLLREPVRQVDRQVETGKRILFEERKRNGARESMSEEF